MQRQTILIGLDGATFTVLDPLMSRGVMPHLEELAGSGVSGELETVIPALTPPAWTSLVTGRSPGQHGIFDFFTKEDPDGHYFRIATSKDVRCETVWSMVQRHGLRTTALNFPLTFPPPSAGGTVLPGWMPWRQLRLGCQPPDLYDRLKSLPGFDARELAMDLSPEAKAIQGCEPDEYVEWVESHVRRDQQWFRIVDAVMKEEPAELTAILFDGVDRIQHLCWRFLDPSLSHRLQSAWEKRVQELCEDYFRQLDGLIAEIGSRAEPDACVMLASDHGFGAQTGTLFVNAWLEQQGHLKWADEGAPRASGSKALGIEQLARHVYLIDWEHTRAYVPTPSGNGVQIVVDRDGSGRGVPVSDYERFRDELAAGLRAIRDPRTGEAVVSRVWKREDVFDGPAMDSSPDLTVVLEDGGLVSILSSDTVFEPRPEPSGTHRPEGIFMARGSGLRKGVRLPKLSILDVAPLLLYSLGLPVPADMEGEVPLAAFDPDRLATAPVRIDGAAASPGATSVPPDAAFTDEDEAELAERLRKLGYL